MAYHNERDYFCDTVSEDVKISLRRKPSLSLESKDELFVQCNQLECQYVDVINRLIIM